MKVAFWNVNMGTTSRQQRKDAFSAWCAWAQPDLLILEEISSTLVGDSDDNVEALSGMTQVAYVNTLDVNLNTTTKCLSALVQTAQEADFDARPLRFPGLEARRLLLKVTHRSGIVVWGIHANASQRGGRDATSHVNTHLGSHAGRDSVVGGDFNYNIGETPDTLTTCHPLNWNGDELAFTQWNQRADSMVNTSTRRAECHVTTNMMSYINPNYLIDYVACGADRNAAAYNNCQNEGMWRDILIDFDHGPVMFDIT